MTIIEQIAERVQRLDPVRQQHALEFVDWLAGAERRSAALTQIRRARGLIVSSGEPLLDLEAINEEVIERRGERA